MNTKAIYKVLLVIVNALACFFFGLFFLGASNNNGEGAPIITEQQALFNQAIYGLGVSLFFSVIVLIISTILRKQMYFTWKNLIRLFFIQFIFLLAVYALVSLFMYII